jgi:glutamate synthase (NADH)
LHSIIAEAGSPTDPREYCISTKEFFADEEGNLKGLQTGKLPSLIPPSSLTQLFRLYTVRVEWTKDSGGRWKPEEMPGTEKYYPAELVFLALGFLGPQPEAIEALGVFQDARSNIKTPNKKFSTNVEGVFAAGDCRRGQSLIVWGIK